MDRDDELEIGDVRSLIASGESEIPVQNLTKGRTIVTRVELSDRLRKLLLVGGLLNSVRGGDGADTGSLAGAGEPAAV